MKAKLLALLSVAVVGTSLGISSAWAQADLAKALVGKWEGAITWVGSAGGATTDPNRTLIIESVTQKDGKWAGTGRFGITGKGLGKVDIEVDDSGSRPFIRIVIPTSTIRLSLVGPKELTGTTTMHGLSPTATARGGNERTLSLQKKD